MKHVEMCKHCGIALADCIYHRDASRPPYITPDMFNAYVGVDYIYSNEVASMTSEQILESIKRAQASIKRMVNAPLRWGLIIVPPRLTIEDGDDEA